MNIVKQYQLGLKYMSIQPKPFRQKTLNFPEIKMIKLFKLSQKMMPPLVILIIVCFYLFRTNLILTIVSGLFALSIPLHAVLWFGYRANSPITLNLIPLYNHLRILLKKEQLVTTLPNFYELMSLLSFAQKQFSEDEIFFNTGKKDE